MKFYPLAFALAFFLPFGASAELFCPPTVSSSRGNSAIPRCETPNYYRFGYVAPTTYSPHQYGYTSRRSHYRPASTYDPRFELGAGWRTHSWYTRRPQVRRAPDDLRDARSSEQLSAIYGDHAQALERAPQHLRGR